jgi:hypothetical protein
MPISTQAVKSILQKAGIDAVETALEPLAYTQVLINPTDTDSQIVDTIDGQFKHQARGTIGWAVDFVWPFVGPILDEQIQSAVTAARAEIAAENASDAAVTATATATEAAASTSSTIVTPITVETSTALAN